MRTLAIVGLVVSFGASAMAGEPIMDSMRFLYEDAKRNAIASAEKADTSLYAFKPADETRTFGQQLAHIADANFLFCSTSLGEPNPHPGAAPGQQGALEKGKTSKSEIVGAVKASFTYCDKAFAQATDASLVEIVELATPAGASEMPRASVLNLAIYHTGRHYGSLATYFRLHDIVPPSTEADLARRPSQ